MQFAKNMARTVVKRTLRPVANFGNHPQEKSSIGLKTVEYSPDFNSKSEAIKTKNTDESNDPLACKEQLKIVHHSLLYDEKYLPSVPKVIEIVPKNILDEPTTCQHCEKELISISKLQTHYDECPNIAIHDESFGNDFENINSEADEAHEDFADESLADESLADESLADDANGIGNIGIKDELSESATQTAILKNPIDVKKIGQKDREILEMKANPPPEVENQIQNEVVGQIQHENGVEVAVQPPVIGKKFPCHICGGQFSSKANVSNHISSVHDGKKDFVCTECDKSFSYKTSLKTHKKRVHDKLKVACPQCDSQVGSAYYLKKHIESVHEKKKKFTCSKCQKTFATKQQSTLHYQKYH